MERRRNVKGKKGAYQGGTTPNSDQNGVVLTFDGIRYAALEYLSILKEPGKHIDTALLRPYGSKVDN